MALVGKWTKIEYIQSETETEIVTINYPAELPEGHPDFNKAGTTEEVEVPKIDIIETIFEDVYAVVHSVNSWKHIMFNGEVKTHFYTCLRIYENKESRELDYSNFIYEEHLDSSIIDYTTGKSEIQQAYELISNLSGFEQLIND